MNVEEAMLNPANVFSCPEDVAREQSLTRAQKIKILRRWEYDARELDVAEEENMGGGPPNMLDSVLAMLDKLDAVVDMERSSPTKQGGK